MESTGEIKYPGRTKTRTGGNSSESHREDNVPRGRVPQLFKTPGPPSWGLCRGLPTHSQKKKTYGQDTLHVPRYQDCLQWNKTRKCNKDFSFGTWNIKSLYRPGSAQNLATEMGKYSVKLVALQEVRWQGTGSVKVNSGSIIYGDCGDHHEFGTGFYIHSSIRNLVKEFKSINKRISYITLAAQWFDITFLNVHAPTEDKEEDSKDEFYDQMDIVYNSLPRHNVKIVLGDFNAKVGRETMYASVMGNSSLHENSNDNGIRLINFTMDNNLYIASTKFQHKNIHKGTWISPDGQTINQIDHIVIQKRFLNSLRDVRTYRGADCGTDHFLVIGKMRIKLKRSNRTLIQDTGYNLGDLEDRETKERYAEEMDERLIVGRREESEIDVNSKWTQIKEVVHEVTPIILGKRKRTSKVWFNEICQRKLDERNTARREWLGNIENIHLRDRYIHVGKETHMIMRQEKRKYYNGILKEAENDFAHHRIRQMYQNVKKVTKKYYKRETFIKDTNGNILTNEKEIGRRWAEYFYKLLNCEEPRELLEFDYSDSIEMDLIAPTESEIEQLIKNLKNNKACGEDRISAELIKNGGLELKREIKNLIDKIWEQEKLPEEWKLAIVCPILKKNDPLICDNYRGISLLDVSYKILSMCLLNRVVPLAEDIIGDYQCGFRRGRSTIDHLFTLRQITEKCWEFNSDVHMLFVDFKRAYDSIHRQSLMNILREFQFPPKLIRLINMGLEQTFCRVRTGGGDSEEFEVRTGLRQGDALSPVLFNLVLEKIDREFQRTHPVGLKVGKREIYRLAYADDVVLLSANKENLIDMASKYRNIARKTGLQINEEKTEYMVVSRLESGKEPLIVDDLVFKKTDSFKYLGSVFDSQNKCEMEIKARQAAANRAYFGAMEVLKNKSLSRKFKLRLYESTILPVALYACETMTFRKIDEQKMLIFERRVLRKIFGPVRDLQTQEWRILKNKELADIYGQPNIVQKMKERRLNWAGHMVRMPENRMPYGVFTGGVRGKRKRGRPRSRWRGNINDDTEVMGLDRNEWIKEAIDRETWRKHVGQAYGQLGQSDG